MSIDSFRILASVAASDGQITAQEKRILQKAARKWGIPLDQVDDVLRGISAGLVELPELRVERVRLFSTLVEIVASDGEIDPGELALVKELGGRFGLQALEVEDLLASAVASKRSGTGRHVEIEPRSEDGFRLLVRAALADGELGVEEAPVLFVAAKEFGIPEESVEAILEEVKGQKQLKITLPKDRVARTKLFSALVSVIVADGVIHERELRLIQKVAPQFGLNELEAEDLLRAANRYKRP